MSFPPFPAKDLAKLVLGYLVDEQLMTAYDEFLQASPYLDALTNEYDRLSMMSLKNMLAEYRGIRLYVESCKPIIVRKKLLQCSNFIEMMKFLVHNVDMNKICEQDSWMHSVSSSRKNTSGSKLMRSGDTSSEREMVDKTVNHDVNTTSLIDLPGNVNVRLPETRSFGSVSQFSEAPRCSQTYTQTATEEQHDTTKCSLNLPVLNNQGPTSSNVQVSMAGTFQEFATGVQGNVQQATVIPDSSTPDNAMTLPQHKEIDNKTDTNSCNLPTATPKSRKSQYIIHVSNTTSDMLTRQPPSTSARNPDGSKITILSDVKVDQNLLTKELLDTCSKSNDSNTNNMPQVLSNSQSTLKAIYVNGTQAYKTGSQLNRNMPFTKDEIMAMPTIILIPTAAPSFPVNSTKTVQSTIKSGPTTTQPLTIDVDMEDSPPTIDNGTTTEVPFSHTTAEPSQNLLVKTTDVTKNASLPKDTHSVINKTATPKVVRPARKSSSTPRRSSHVRVLDFTTPRRILNEPISEDAVDIVETVISKSPNLASLEVGKPVENVNSGQRSREVVLNPVTPVTKKNKNWDADLRAAAIMNQNEPGTKLDTAPGSSKSSTSKKQEKCDSDDGKTDVTLKSDVKKKSKHSSKSKKSKKKSSDKGDNTVTLPQSVVAVKPTTSVNTERKGDAETQTPEMDPVSLQHAIGANLNISDFLETPYKKAMYDIQMETPRFMGSDMVTEPISDIKITNIPTPRFLNSPGSSHTPKTLQPTPSSYTSRLTDYSSGGSYYKPDHDFAPEGLCPTTSENAQEVSSTNTPVVIEETTNTRKSTRPVRQCTKNISYCTSPILKAKVSKDSDMSDDMNVIKGEPESSSKDLEQVSNIGITKKTSTTKKSPIKKSTSKKSHNNKNGSMSTEDVNKKNQKKISITLKIPNKSNRKRTKSKNKDATVPVTESSPIRSRRKSSTPRKLPKEFNSGSSKDGSPKADETELVKESEASAESDADIPPLRWSDDGSQDYKPQETKSTTDSDTIETEDISKIKEYIESLTKKDTNIEGAKLHIANNDSISLHINLMKRGFDIETAKSIERDLLDSTSSTAEGKDNSRKCSPSVGTSVRESCNDIKKLTESDKTTRAEESGPERISECSMVSNTLQIDETEYEDDLDFSVCDCDENSKNYIPLHHDERLKCLPNPVKLKDKFCMDVYIEDVTIRLSATPFTMTLDEDCEASVSNIQSYDASYYYDSKETEAAVKHISNLMYTPRKELTREEQCLQIFDSTLASLDTPLKTNTPKRKEMDRSSCREYSPKQSEIRKSDSAEEQVSEDSKKDKPAKKRKCMSGSTSDESGAESKRSKPQYLPNIQNFDIESVLSKLHGS